MVLELERVSVVSGGQPYLYGVDLRLVPGAINVLLGPTQAGKTALMRVMAGLDRPNGGRVLVDGQDVTGVSVRQRNLAMVYQQFINYPAMTVYDNIASPLKLQKIDTAQITQRVNEVAAKLHIEHLLQRRPGELSGGQQQRCALARALVKRSSLVLLDEPLVNLDYKLREELREELPRLFARTGAILVYATTEPAEALMLGGNAATLSLGEVTQFGPTAEVFRQPRDLVTAQTFSDPPLNIARVEKSGADFNLAGHPVRAPNLPDGRYTLGVRSHHLRLSDQGVPGVVRAAEMTGSESFIHVETPLGTWVVTTAGVHDPAMGAAVKLAVDPARLLVFDSLGDRVAA